MHRLLGPVVRAPRVQLVSKHVLPSLHPKMVKNITKCKKVPNCLHRYDFHENFGAFSPLTRVIIQNPLPQRQKWLYRHT